MRIGAYAALLLLGLAALSPAWAGIPVLANCEIWADPDTAEVQDTITVYVVIRDLYAEGIPGLSCDYFSSRGPTDIILGSPAITDQYGQASARVTTTYEPHFSQANITVEVEEITLGPVTIYWRCRAGVDDPGDGLAVTALYQNSPNPFGDLTEIGYSVEASADVTLDIFNVAGKRVRTLAPGWASPGRHSVAWDGADDHGTAMPSGIYYVRMSEPTVSASRPITLLR
jgi:hypothetical protein